MSSELYNKIDVTGLADAPMGEYLPNLVDTVKNYGAEDWTQFIISDCTPRQIDEMMLIELCYLSVQRGVSNGHPAACYAETEILTLNKAVKNYKQAMRIVSTLEGELQGNK